MLNGFYKKRNCFLCGKKLIKSNENIRYCGPPQTIYTVFSLYSCHFSILNRMMYDENNKLTKYYFEQITIGDYYLVFTKDYVNIFSINRKEQIINTIGMYMENSPVLFDQLDSVEKLNYLLRTIKYYVE